MHILINVLHRPTRPTGVCRYGVNLARCLSETSKIQKITVVIGIWQRKYFTELFDLSSPKIDLVSIKIEKNSIARNLWYLFGLPELVDKLKPDLVHLAFPLPFLPKKFSVPVISTIHDLYPYEYPENFGYPNVLFNRLFLKEAIFFSSGLTCVSQLTLAKLKKYFPFIQDTQKLSVIYNYVYFSSVDIAYNRPLNNLQNCSFLLCVAQHRKNKNLPLLIEAYYLLFKNNKINSNTKLTIVGDCGLITEKIEQQINNLGLQDRIILISGISDGQLCWLYQNCLLFAIASSTEGFCLPLAEALYFNCKIVCSDIPIFREIGTANCIYFNLEGDSVYKCFQALQTALKLEDISTEATEEFAFFQETATKQYIDFYASITRLIVSSQAELKNY